MRQFNYDIINGLIHAETLRQDKKWGANRIMNPQLIAVILGEEYGEVCRAILNMMKTDDVAHEAHKANYKEELVQIAAFAIAAINSFMLQEEMDTERLTKVKLVTTPDPESDLPFEGFLSPRCPACAVENAKAEFYVESDGTKVGMCTLCGSPFATDVINLEGITVLDDLPG